MKSRLEVGAACLTFALAATAGRADTLEVQAPELPEGFTWSVIAAGAEGVPRLGAGFERSTFWDLRPLREAGTLVRHDVVDPADVALAARASEVGADRALCTREVATDAPIGCSLFLAAETGPLGPRARWTDLPGEWVALRGASFEPLESLVAGDAFRTRASGPGTIVDGRAVAEGIALLPAGPREVVLVREVLDDLPTRRLRYRFLTRTGLVAAVIEGPLPAAGEAFAPRRAELLVSADPRADDGLKIRYSKLSAALVPGTLGFLQYSLETDTALGSVRPGWSTVADVISIDQTGVAYQPDPGDPASLTTLPEVWDFTTLVKPNLPYRTFNTTRDDLVGSGCLTGCALRDTSPTAPDGTWKAYLKIDNYSPGGAYFTRDVFTLNDNDTGANPSIDVPYVAQDELNTSGRTQICFQQSAGGANRFLRFFRFTGATPATAVLGVGDTWTSGAWTECDNTNGLRLTIASECGSQCYPGCSAPVAPRARGMLGAGAGFRATILEDGFVRVAPGNFVPALLMRQDTDVQAGADLFGICNVGTVRNRSFDYFWIQEHYGLLALVSSPTDTTGNLPPGDWSSVGNMTDGADFTWGPYPPYQTQADACLAGTLVRWALPADGSNLNGEPGIADYGYVVSWGNSTDPETLANWTTNPNRSPLPGQAGYLAAPAGSEPTSYLITGWAGASINATVVTALRYTDPDAADQKSYRSAAFYRVVQDPARLDGATFRVGNGVAPFVGKSGSDLTLAWPGVPGAASYLLRVWNLDTRAEIACPAGLNCSPTTPSAIFAGAAATGANYGFRAFAVDPCGAPSAN